MELTCPKCHGVMRQYERNGVTIDQCADCRGLFLDRGELERLVDAENSWHGSDASRSQPSGPPPQQYGGQSGGQYGGQPYPPHKKKKRSFLDDLFD